MSKQIKYAIIAAVVIVVGLVIYFVTRQKEEPVPIVLGVNRNVADTQKVLLEDRVAQADVALAAAQTDEARRDAYVAKAEALYELGKLDEARMILDESIKLDPGHALSYMVLHQVQSDMNDFDAAHGSIKKSLELNPKSPSRWLVYINFMKDKRDAEREVLDEIYKSAMAANENSIDLIMAYAKFNTDTENYEVAKEYWRKAGEINPSNKINYDLEIQGIDQK